jgi:hypothetical protein
MLRDDILNDLSSEMSLSERARTEKRLFLLNTRRKRKAEKEALDNQ